MQIAKQTLITSVADSSSLVNRMQLLFPNDLLAQVIVPGKQNQMRRDVKII